jgi:hypothetical protein
MGQVLRTEVRYGIFRCFLGSLLLWKRTSDNKTTPIPYTDRTVPSWSWMAYSGGIDFIADAKQLLVVSRIEDLGFKRDGKALKVKVRQFGENCRMEQEGEGHAIVNGAKRVGFVWFDVADRFEFKHCVVVGMGEDEEDDPQKTYYVLIIREKADGLMKTLRRLTTSFLFGKTPYERLGVGKVEAQYVSIDCEAGTLW